MSANYNLAGSAPCLEGQILLARFWLGGGKTGANFRTPKRKSPEHERVFGAFEF